MQDHFISWHVKQYGSYITEQNVFHIWINRPSFSLEKTKLLFEQSNTIDKFQCNYANSRLNTGLCLKGRLITAWQNEKGKALWQSYRDYAFLFFVLSSRYREKLIKSVGMKHSLKDTLYIHFQPKVSFRPEYQNFAKWQKSKKNQPY